METIQQRIARQLETSQQVARLSECPETRLRSLITRTADEYLYNSVPMWVAMRVTELKAVQQREFYLSARRDEWFHVQHVDGTEEAGGVVLVDTNDSVNIGFDYVYDGHIDGPVCQTSGVITAEGQLKLLGRDQMVWGVFPACCGPVTLRDHHGQVDQVTFNRVDTIRVDPNWPTAWVEEVNARRPANEQEGAPIG